jgi:hypothetical protein
MTDTAHHARQISLDKLPFYDSLLIVKDGTKLPVEDLLPFLAGFKASPTASVCCNHEWNAFDVFN